MLRESWEEDDESERAHTSAARGSGFRVTNESGSGDLRCSMRATYAAIGTRTGKCCSCGSSIWMWNGTVRSPSPARPRGARSALLAAGVKPRNTSAGVAPSRL